MRKNGFTLIELMAIIIILGLIAAIVVPGTSRMIEKAKQKTAVDSTYGYVETFEKYITNKVYNDEIKSATFEGSYSINGENLTRTDDYSFELNGKNLETISGEVEVDAFGNVTSGYFLIGKYEVYYNGSNATTLGLITEGKVRSVMLEQNIIIEEDTSYQISSNVYPTYAKDKTLTWTTSNPEIAVVDNNGYVTSVAAGSVTIYATSNNGVVGSTIITITPIPFTSGELVKADSVYDFVNSYLLINSGVYTLELPNKEKILVELYIINGDTVYSATPTMCDDVADTKMCIYKYNGNVNINSGVVLTPQVRKKGFVLFSSGVITNAGNISMTARGATATGQDVILFKNNDLTNEYIPKVGAAGGASYLGTGTAPAGAAGTSRKSGGGGAGGHYGKNAGSGAGGSGTSYSGGAGGGGAATDNSSYKAGDGSSIGGPGGYAGSATGGGAGNPGGSGLGVGGTGTGGLLIIYSNSFINTGSITSNGVKGGNTTYYGPGGGSGGGSINIFYVSSVTKGTITSTGGPTGSGSRPGGKGGNGAISVGSISTGKYISD